MSTTVTLTGRITRDPELKFSNAGKAVTRFSVVTSRRVKDRNTNEWSDADTTFWECVAFGELAQNLADSLVKGAAVIVTGHASQEEWTTKDGEKRKSLKVVAEDVAASLRFASAKVMKAGQPAASGSQAAPREESPFADEPPF